jgi:hypothetical protein
LALYLGGLAGRARLIGTRLGLKPDWGKLNVRFLGRALETLPWEPD